MARVRTPPLGWWYRLWGKVLPYWGDPFCAAYLTVWSQFYWSRRENRATVDVGWDRLPEAIKAAILERHDEDDDSAETPHCRPDETK